MRVMPTIKGFKFKQGQKLEDLPKELQDAVKASLPFKEVAVKEEASKNG